VAQSAHVPVIDWSGNGIQVDVNKDFVTNV
jgi:hypothetical protein